MFVCDETPSSFLVFAKFKQKHFSYPSVPSPSEIQHTHTGLTLIFIPVQTPSIEHNTTHDRKNHIRGWLCCIYCACKTIPMCIKSYTHLEICLYIFMRPFTILKSIIAQVNTKHIIHIVTERHMSAKGVCGWVVSSSPSTKCRREVGEGMLLMRVVRNEFNLNFPVLISNRFKCVCSPRPKKREDEWGSGLNGLQNEKEIRTQRTKMICRDKSVMASS